MKRKDFSKVQCLILGCFEFKCLEKLNSKASLKAFLMCKNPAWVRHKWWVTLFWLVENDIHFSLTKWALVVTMSQMSRFGEVDIFDHINTMYRLAYTVIRHQLHVPTSIARCTAKGGFVRLSKLKSPYSWSPGRMPKL